IQEKRLELTKSNARRLLMANLNKVFLIGRLTRDPDYKEFEGSGTKVCDLGLATSRNWRDRQSGEKKEETTFIDVKVWGRQAEIANQYLNKGREVMIEGRLETRILGQSAPSFASSLIAFNS
ncbi:MAG: single-stranded DNA-binding protein, partial [Planctomycetota bacterium]|nr:single-stranded DNA-binding protein [Planctomycetota bacterium]